MIKVFFHRGYEKSFISDHRKILYLGDRVYIENGVSRHFRVGHNNLIKISEGVAILDGFRILGQFVYDGETIYLTNRRHMICMNTPPDDEFI